jgi:hypothetical protein
VPPWHWSNLKLEFYLKGETLYIPYNPFYDISHRLRMHQRCKRSGTKIFDFC